MVGEFGVVSGVEEELNERIGVEKKRGQCIKEIVEIIVIGNG